MDKRIIVAIFGLVLLINNLKSQSCDGYIAADPSYVLAMPPCDDCSSLKIGLPFNFCFYGVSYDSLYINSNGIISFANSYISFSSTMPDSTPIIAPFFADSDTRGVGSVKYKITPTAIFINWENIGYYNSHTDKTNTFSVIITDGNDPNVPNGNNLSFSYYNMEWTTGDASGGTSGFGSTDAFVGVNKGDSIIYTQLGRFNQPGFFYDGNYGTIDGVSWLNGKNFYLNTCSPSSNVAPIINKENICDSIIVCESDVDTLNLNYSFISPTAIGTTSVIFNNSSMPVASVLNLSNGNTTNITVQIPKALLNVGLNSFELKAISSISLLDTTYYTFDVFKSAPTAGIYGSASYSGIPLSNGGTAVLYKKLTYFTTLDTVKISNIDVAGDFAFDSILTGDYIVKVFPNSAYPTVNSTYYNSEYLWDSALAINHDCFNSDTIIITMIETISLSGAGAISGVITEGSGFTRLEGDPIPGIDVKLGRNPGGQLVASTQTDVNGVYTFSSVPFNDGGANGVSYTVYVDIPGLGRDSSYVIILNASNPIADSLDYLADSTTIYINENSSTGISNIDHAKENRFTVYPNPFNASTTVAYTLYNSSSVKLEIYNVLGEKVQTIVNGTQATGEFKYNLNNLNQGVYFVSLMVDGKASSIRVIKTN